MQELKGTILSQNHRRSQGFGPGGPGPLNWNAINHKSLTKNPCFFIFSFFFSIFACNSTRVQQYLTINNIYDRGPGVPP